MSSTSRVKKTTQQQQQQQQQQQVILQQTTNSSIIDLTQMQHLMSKHNPNRTPYPSSQSSRSKTIALSARPHLNNTSNVATKNNNNNNNNSNNISIASFINTTNTNISLLPSSTTLPNNSNSITSNTTASSSHFKQQQHQQQQSYIPCSLSSSQGGGYLQNSIASLQNSCKISKTLLGSVDLSDVTVSSKRCSSSLAHNNSNSTYLGNLSSSGCSPLDKQSVIRKYAEIQQQQQMQLAQMHSQSPQAYWVQQYSAIGKQSQQQQHQREQLKQFKPNNTTSINISSKENQDSLVFLKHQEIQKHGNINQSQHKQQQQQHDLNASSSKQLSNSNRPQRYGIPPSKQSSQPSQQQVLLNSSISRNGIQISSKNSIQSSQENQHRLTQTIPCMSSQTLSTLNAENDIYDDENIPLNSNRSVSSILRTSEQLQSSNTHRRLPKSASSNNIRKNNSMSNFNQESKGNNNISINNSSGNNLNGKNDKDTRISTSMNISWKQILAKSNQKQQDQVYKQQPYLQGIMTMEELNVSNDVNNNTTKMKNSNEEMNHDFKQREEQFLARLCYLEKEGALLAETIENEDNNVLKLRQEFTASQISRESSNNYQQQQQNQQSQPINGRTLEKSNFNRLSRDEENSTNNNTNTANGQHKHQQQQITMLGKYVDTLSKKLEYLEESEIHKNQQNQLLLDKQQQQQQIDSYSQLRYQQLMAKYKALLVVSQEIASENAFYQQTLNQLKSQCSEGISEQGMFSGSSSVIKALSIGKYNNNSIKSSSAQS